MHILNSSENIFLVNSSFFAILTTLFHYILNKHFFFEMLPEFPGFLEIVGQNIQEELRVRISVDVTVSNFIQVNS
jgi:hypothetical protein